MIRIVEKGKKKSIAGIETIINNVISVKDFNDVMFYLVNHDMPEEIVFDDELTNNQEYSKIVGVLKSFCKNLKIAVPKIKIEKNEKISRQN